jgi:hypothetical protein
MNIILSPLTNVDSYAINSLGQGGVDQNGKEYIYLAGVNSTVAGDLVRFDENYQTARSEANITGACAVALAATITGKFGWYQVYGDATVNTNGDVAADKALYVTASYGCVDDAAVAGDLIFGITSMTGRTGAGPITAFLNYPMCYDGAYLV